VLDRLIDEELLVQYGLSLGLAQSDRRIRSDFVSAVIAAQVASVDGYDPSDGEVREFYLENQNFFRPPGRLRVRDLWVRAEPARSPSEALARAREAAVRLGAGESFAAVEAAYGDPQVARVPDALLPPAKLREYVGPSALVAAETLAVGEVSEPLVTRGGVRVLVLLAKEDGEAPALEAVETEVRNEMKRRAGDAAVRGLLDELRASGRLQTADVLP
jgi:parvulin-like peptidyl-prolyl isomerase